MCRALEVGVKHNRPWYRIESSISGRDDQLETRSNRSGCRSKRRFGVNVRDVKVISQPTKRVVRRLWIPVPPYSKFDVRIAFQTVLCFISMTHRSWRCGNRLGRWQMRRSRNLSETAPAVFAPWFAHFARDASGLTLLIPFF